MVSSCGTFLHLLELSSSLFSRRCQEFALPQVPDCGVACAQMFYLPGKWLYRILLDAQARVFELEGTNIMHTIGLCLY